MARNTKLAIIIMAVLLIIAGIFAFLNYDSVLAKKASQRAEEFTVKLGDKTVYVSMDQIEDIGLKDISANYKPSGKAPTQRVYQGVAFSDVIEYFGLDLSQYKTINFTAADGYTTSITKDEALNGEKCVIAVALDGEKLGIKQNGGSGPFMMILPEDKFSQRWCKFMMEVSAS